MDIDGLSAEHLQFCHPILPVILKNNFNLMTDCSFVPDGFEHSYIVPVSKPKEHYSKSLTCNDFRASLSVLYCLKYLSIVLLIDIRVFWSALIISLVLKKELAATLLSEQYAA